MKRIKEIIVVEGQNDINKVQSCLDCDCIKTNGTHISQDFLEQLKGLNEKRGVIVFTDDDYPGRMIRSQIQAALKNVKHARVDRSISRTSKKVGVEHASCEAIIDALSDVITFESSRESFPFSSYLEMDLVLDHKKRNFWIKKLGLAPMNSKRFFKVLNMMGKTPQELVL